MIVKNQYPICEFDTNKNPIIHPTNFLTENLPKKCVITYLRKELEHFCKENKLPIIGHLNSEVFDIPIYEYANDTDRLCITMALCGAPGAAVALEELYAMGCETFIVCGGAGALTNDSKVGEIIVPVSAVRDEGTSYHYLAPSREIECHKETVEKVVSYLKEMEVPFKTGKTWTSDAIYRETPDMIERRRSEGCITVEMEAAAFFAVSHYYHRGHLIADRFNGSGELENLVPMEGKLNKGDYAKLEDTLAEAVKDGADVRMKVEPVYSGNLSRPDEFRVSYTIDGDKEIVVFKNRSEE